MKQTLSFSNARVLVTGGGSGLGRLLACGAAQRGAQEVVIWDLSEQRAQASVSIIENRGCQARALAVDVTDQAAVTRAAEETGAIDILINNAGVVSGRALLDNNPASIERTLQVNLHSLFWVTRAFLPGMLERDHGRIVTISSAAGLVGPAKMTDYSASKFGAFGFNEALRNELRQQSSQVSTLIVAPYYMSTGMFAGVTTRFSALLPILPPATVAIATLDAIESRRAVLVMPWFVNSMPLLRLLPPDWMDALADFFGINHGMDEFHGRASDRV
ncbi:MAG: SDR family oxidoreductase [Propionibacteriaceae bacterium]|nr:SDR family oxidoreductase [Propionibacteriaceae bacterium]